MWLGATAVLVLVADQLTKFAVRATLDVNESLTVIPGILDLARVQNTGAAFGLLPGRQELFIGVSLLMLVGVTVYWLRERPTEWPVVIALGLVVGGAIGNLLDRAIVGRVTDFLAFSLFSPVFNIADSAIVVGVGVLILWLFFGPAQEESAVSDSDAAVEDVLPAESGREGGQDCAHDRDDGIADVGIEAPR